MRAVFKHELNSYFTNLMGYVFGTFLLLFAGLYTMVINIDQKLVSFEEVFYNMDFIFMIIIPVLTMRVLAEERRQKTDQLLYSLPLTMTKVVLGKYLAMLVILALPTAIICLYPLVLTAYGSVHLPTVMAAAVGFFLLGAALLAIGMYISSITENQAVAAGVCFVVVLINYFLGTLAGYLPSTAIASVAALSAMIIILAIIIRQMTKSNYAALISGMILETILMLIYIVNPDIFEGLVSGIVGELSVFERFYVFVNGIFDITGVVYLLSVVVFFLFLSIQSMEKRRWSE